VIFGSLFSGIGGLDLACEAVGWRCAWQVEIDPFCRAILAKHWPDVERFEDVRDVGADRLVRVDVVVGGFPCQDISVAGSRRGVTSGTRSRLWFDFLRIVQELGPRGVIVENVGGLAGRDLDTVATGLDGAGYAVEIARVAASDVGAPHRRIRHFILGFRGRGVADADVADLREQRRSQDGSEAARIAAGACQAMADAAGERLEVPKPGDAGDERAAPSGADRRAAVSRVGGGPDGLPAGLVGPGPGGVWPAARGEEQSPWEPPRTISGPRDSTGGRKMRLKALGNAIVPQQGAVAAMRLRELLGVSS
jgi:DNA (cytosine-5)-methyltransferase 1